MVRKKKVESERDTLADKNLDLKREVHELRAELQATHTRLLEEQKRVNKTISDADFSELVRAVRSKLDEEIVLSGRLAARQWTLVQVKKNLESL